jgi:site-specific DNA-methyltransferase (adenine-specific)
MQRKGNARFDNSDKHAFDHSAPTDLPGPMWIDGATGKWTGHNATTTDPQALQWQGWGTNLKPAHEPILIARKPIDKTVANTVLKHGTGAINIDACRVPPNGDPLGGGMLTSGRPTLNLDHNIDWDRPWMRNEVEAKRHKQEMKIKTAYAEQHGRWPANVIHDGSDEVLSGFPETRNGMTKWLNASRFFFSAKATAQDRNGSAHPTVKPVKLMEYLIKLITPPNGIIVDPFAGSGTTGQAAQNLGFDIILIERELQYINDIKRRFAPVEVLPEC